MARRDDMHRLLDDWLDEVERKQPDGELGEDASFKLSMFRHRYDGDGAPLWTWTVERSRTMSEYSNE